MSIKTIFKILKQSLKFFLADKVLKLSASLAYYTVFSLPALLIIVIWISDVFYGNKAAEGTVYRQMEEFIGTDAALQMHATIREVSQSTGSGFATIVGIITLVLGATGVFGEIQDSINRIWHLKAKPRKGKGWIRLIINRLISFSMVITLGFLLLVSLIINGLMEVFIEYLSSILPDIQVIFVYIFNLLITFLITVLLFSIIFKVLPDARIKWKQVRAGAIAAAILFMGGRFLISYYLGHNKLSSAYGAAGSVIVILLWVYYSSAILYFGAVFTKAWVTETRQRIYPCKYAVWIEETESQPDRSPTNKPKR